MKNLGIILVLVITAVMVVGCASAPVAESAADAPTVQAQPVQRSVMIDHQAGATRGYEVPGCYPEWVAVILDGQDAPLRDLYPNNAVFTSRNRGEDLDGLKYWANTFNVNGLVAGEINTSFNSKAGGSDGGNADEYKQAGDTLIGVVVDAEFTGLSKEAEYWILWQSPTGEKEYEYMVLYTMTNEMLNTNLDNILNDVPEAERAVITPVIDRIKEEGLFD